MNYELRELHELFDLFVRSWKISVRCSFYYYSLCPSCSSW